MRIRRRDRGSTQQPQVPAFVPFDQDTKPPADPPGPPSTGPTSTDPVKGLEPDADPGREPGVGEPAASPQPAEPAPPAASPAVPAAAGQPPHPEATVEGAPAEEPTVEEATAQAPSETATEPVDRETAAAAETTLPQIAVVTETPAEPLPGDASPEEPAAGAVPDLDAVALVVPIPGRKRAKPAPEPPVEDEPVMRAPSIRDEATELLNGSKPAARELPRVIAIANQKGGVGKTTTTVNLGAALAELDYRVLVIDLDPQGNATTGLGVDARNFELSMYDVIMRDQPLEDCIEPTSVKNLFVAPATIDLAGVEIELVPAFSRELKLKRAVESIVDDFDFVLIDCPPSLGLITVNGLAAADEVLVPIQCEYYALEGLSQLLRNVNLVSTNLNATLEVTTIVLTMFDARTRLSVDVANEVREHFSERVCQAVIPRTVRLSEAPSFGQPITVFDPASRGAVAYRELAKEVSDGAPQRAR